MHIIGRNEIFSYLAITDEDFKYTLFGIFGGRIVRRNEYDSEWGRSIDDSWPDFLKRK